MIEDIWNLLCKFSEEAHHEALVKCAEYGFDPNSVTPTLNESYINLAISINLLRDAIEKNKLIQLPITIQNELLQSLTSIDTQHTALIGGTNSAPALAKAIEKLYTDIWRYGLNHLSDEVLGYQTKINQLKEIERSVVETKIKLEEGLAVKGALDAILIDSKQQNETLHTYVATADEISTKATAILDDIKETSENAAKSTEAILANQQNSAEALENTQANNKLVEGNEKKIKELVEGFTNLTAKLEENKKTQDALFDEFEAYRVKINGLLDDANRTGLAASFTNRGRQLFLPLLGWLFVFGCSIIGLLYMGIKHIAPILESNSATPWEQLPLRLALTAPFIWLGWFSARQYGFTSRLREDYAYKEASAKSFEGYKREAKEVDVEMLKKLLEQAIKNLGDNPIRIYSGHDNHPSPTHELIDNIMKDEKSVSKFKEFWSIFKT